MKIASMKNENRVKQKILVSGELIFEWNVESPKLYSLIEIKYLTFWRISSYVERVVSMYRLGSGVTLDKEKKKEEEKKGFPEPSWWLIS